MTTHPRYQYQLAELFQLDSSGHSNGLLRRLLLDLKVKRGGWLFL